MGLLWSCTTFSVCKLVKRALIMLGINIGAKDLDHNPKGVYLLLRSPQTHCTMWTVMA